MNEAIYLRRATISLRALGRNVGGAEEAVQENNGKASGAYLVAVFDGSEICGAVSESCW